MATNDIALLFRIKGDTSQATGTLKDFRKEVKALEDAAKNGATGLEQFAASAGLSAEQFIALRGGVEKWATATVAGFSAVAAGAAVAGAAIFTMAKNAAYFGSAIYDATQKTGLSATKLSALKIAADQSGSSFEQVTKGIVRFGSEVGKAGQGNDEAVKNMRLLGVTARDLDTALSQAIKTIGNASDETQQLALASAAFGQRIGPDLIPLIRDAGGNVDALVKKFKDLGLTINDEAARQADAFGDQLDTLESQFASIGRTIGFAFLPVFNGMAKDLSNWLKQNQGEVKAWSKTFAESFDQSYKSIVQTTAGVKALTGTSTAKWAKEFIYWLEQISIYLNPIALASVKLGETLREAAPPDKSSTVAPAINYARPQDTKAFQQSQFEGEQERKKKADEAAKAAEEFNKRQLQGQLQYLSASEAADKASFERNRDEWEQAYKDRLVTQQQFIDAVEKNEASIREAEADKIAKEYELRRKQEKLTSAQIIALNQEEKNAYQKVLDESQKRQADARKETLEQEKKANAESLQVFEDRLNRELELREAHNNVIKARFAVDVDRGALSAEEAKIKADQLDYELNQRQLQILEAIRAKRKELGLDTLEIENEIKVQQEKNETDRLNNLREENKLHQERIDLLYKAVDAAKDLNDQLNEAEGLQRSNELANREGTGTGSGRSGMGLIPGPGILGGVGEDLKGIFGIIPDTKILDDGKTVMKDYGEFMKEVFADVSSSIAGSIADIVQGLGQMAVAWISTGKFSAKAALEMAANVAIGLAIQAGIKAIFEFAEGLASQASTFGIPNPSSIMHFAAASTFATIAAVSGIAGVGLALGARAAGGGGSKASSSAGVGSGGRAAATVTRDTENEGKAYSSKSDRTIAEGRNAPAGPAVTVTLRIKDDSTWLGKMLQADADGNGKSRAIIRRVAAEG
jgi:hypothetical protein